MKVLCPQCERLAELGRFRVDAGQLYVTCARCGAEMAAGASAPETVSEPVEASRPAPVASSPPPAPLAPPASTGDEAAATARVASAPSRPPSQPPRVSLASSPTASNVVMLRTASVEAVERAAQSADASPFEVPEGHCPKCLARRDGSPSCPQCGVQFLYFQEAHVAPPVWLKQAWVELLRDWGNDAQHDRLRARAQQEDALTALGRLYRLRLAVEPNDPIAEKGRGEVLRLAAAPMTYRPSAETAGTSRAKTVLVVVVVAFCLAAIGFLFRIILTQTP